MSYNRLVARRQDVADSWATIDVELQRRHVLVPQLVASVQAAATHERELLAELGAATPRPPRHPTHRPQRRRGNHRWQQRVRQVIALRERYPALNSQQNFLRLQHELAITEDRIAASRRFYNTRVQKLNTAIEAFPSNLVASRHHVVDAVYFERDA